MVSIFKDEKEIEVLRSGGKRLAGIIKRLSSSVYIGMKTLELEEMARKLIETEGDSPAFLGYQPHGAKRPFPAALCVSVNEEVVHGIPNEEEKILKEGDVVSIDMGLIHKNLITDMAVTVGVGKISERSKNLISATRKCLEEAISSIKAGGTIGDIGYAIQTEALKCGFGSVTDLGGHGVGREVHSDPYVPNCGNPGEGEKLVSGMVLAIEPMLTEGSSKVKLLKDGYTYITRDGSKSAHFEHTVLITEKGCDILTQV